MRFLLLLFAFVWLAPTAQAEPLAPGLRGDVEVSAQSHRRRVRHRHAYRGWYGGGYFPGPVAGYDGNTFYGTSTAWRYDGYPGYAGGGLPNYGTREYNDLPSSGATYYRSPPGRCRVVNRKGGRSALHCRWRD